MAHLLRDHILRLNNREYVTWDEAFGAETSLFAREQRESIH